MRGRDRTYQEYMRLSRENDELKGRIDRVREMCENAEELPEGAFVRAAWVLEVIDPDE